MAISKSNLLLIGFIFLLFMTQAHSYDSVESFNGLIVGQNNTSINCTGSAQNCSNMSTYCNATNQTNCIYTDDQLIEIITINIFIYIPVFIDSQGNAIFCPPGCYQCISGSQCQTCFIGYSLDSNKNCIPCKGCKTCSVSDPSICISCFLPMKFNSTTNKCDVPVACTNPGCQTCSDATTCLTCYQGFGLSSNDCVACVQGCNKCTTSLTDCDLDGCSTGHVYNYNTRTGKKQCLECTAGCASCSIDNLDNCLSCIDGYYFYLDNTKTPAANSCKACLANCKTCTSIATCQKCMKGYILTSDSLSCVSRCSFPCYKCVQNSPTKCTKCFGGYTLNSTTQTCIVDISCNSTGSCLACNIGTVLVGGYCKPCSVSDSNCNNCLASNLTVCSSCEDGYYLSTSSSCMVCPTGCSICFSQHSCSACNDGYYLNKQFGQVTGKCQSCQDPCSSCYISPKICSSCVSGFTLVGSKCQGQINVRYVVVINIVYSLWASISFEFTQFIWIRCKRVRPGFFRRRLFMRRLMSGSTSVSGTVSPSSSSDASAIGSTLSSDLAAGTSIGGSPIISSTVSVNGTDDANLGLILGVSIPLCILVVIILVFIAFKLNKDQKYKEYEKPNKESYSENQFKNNNL